MTPGTPPQPPASAPTRRPRPSSSPAPQMAAGRQQARPLADINPSADHNADAPFRPHKKSWPVLEIVVILLLVKIVAGGWYILSDHNSAGAVSSPSAAALAESGLPLFAPQSAVQPESQQISESSRVSDYLAAAADAVSPSVAQAASPSAMTTAATSGNAVASGAFMVLGAQSVTGEVGGRVDTIPLPPGGDDLMDPALQSPSSLPRLSGDSAPLPPDNASGSINNAQNQGSGQNIREREQALARREALLATKAEALTNLEAELGQRLAALEASRSEIETMTRRNEATLQEMKILREQQKKEDEVLADARIQHLVTAYKGMKADQAGILVSSLDDDVAVAILSAMPGRNAGLILANVIPEKAARLTKAISERRIDPNLLLADNPPPQ